MKKIIFISTLLLFALGANAQDYVNNGLLFSRTQPNGSARMLGLGGSHVALGGDYSAALSNPAGLGFYNRSEISITPSLNFLSSTSSYYGTTAPKESRSAFSVPGLSLVLHTPSERTKGFLGGTFAITLSRLNDFHQDFRYQGYNDQNSMIDYFIEDAGTIDPSELLINNGVPGDYFYSLTALAYNNYLIEENYDENDNIVGYGTVLNFNRVRQEEVSERKGPQTQWSIAYGANFNDKLYLGASIGITSIKYKLSQVYTEDDFRYNDGAPNALDGYTVTESYDIRGTGVNFTLGAIFRPADFIQVGASFVTPTYYGLTDKYHALIESRWNNFEYYEDEFLNDVNQGFPEDDVYEYNLVTPLKASMGISLMQKYGLVSFSTEYIDYGKAKYSSDVASEFSGENDAMSLGYKSVFNHTLGMEYRHDVMRFRIGANYMSDPYENNADLDRSVKTLSGGVGVRLNNFFSDLAVNHSWTEARRIPYFTVIGVSDPMAKIDYKNTRYTLTIGFTF